MLDQRTAHILMLDQILHAAGTALLASLSPFLIRNVVDGDTGRMGQVRKLTSGNCLVIKASAQVKNLLWFKKFYEYDTVASGPVIVPSSGGVISRKNII